MGRLFLFSAIFSILLVLLFFPIFINGSIYFDLNEKKLSFCLKLFKQIRLKGGYVTRYSDGFVLHVNKKKAILVPYSKIYSKRKVFSVARTFEFLSLKCVLESNLEKMLPFLFAKRAFEICKPIYPKLNNSNFSFWLTQNDCFKLTAECTLFFTNYILLMDLFEFIGRKITSYGNKK